MRIARYFLIIGLLYLLGFLLHVLVLNKAVYGDGIFYFSWLHSIAVDHDAKFNNEYAFFGADQPIATYGAVGNKYTVGPAILWLPAYLTTHTLFRTGLDLPYQLSVGLISVLYAVVGIILLFRLLSNYFSQITAFISTAAIAFCTNLLFYGSLEPVSSHSVSFFAATLFLTFLFARQKSWPAIGVSLALIGLIRTQDLVYGLLLIPYWKNASKILPWFAIGFLPQLVAWQLLYGKFWISPYLTSGEGFNFFEPHILGVLFSLQNGVFLWTPILALAAVGFLLKDKHQKLLGQFGLVILAQLVLVSSWSTWWQGASYSGRMFVSTLPLFAFSLAGIFSKLASYRWMFRYVFILVVAPLAVINTMLIGFFLYAH